MPLERTVVLASTRDRAYFESFDKPPKNQVEVRYDKQSWSKGEAWRDLREHEPTFQFRGYLWVSLFPRIPSRSGDPRRANPYRKTHREDNAYWSWVVVDWRIAKRKPRVRSRVPTVSETRYDLILKEGWL